MKKSLASKGCIIVIMLWSTVHAFGENPCNTMWPQKSGAWGVGFFWFSEAASVPVYNKPFGDQVGTMTRDKYRLLYQPLSSKGKIEIQNNDFVWAGHISSTLLKVYKTRSDGFYRVLDQSTNLGLWIRLDAADKIGIKFLTYRSLLLTPENDTPEELASFLKFANIGVNVEGQCLNLRREHSLDSEILKCLPPNDDRGFTHSHIKILERIGDWVKVDATFFVYDEANDDSGEGCAFKEQAHYTGWLKAVDESGFPNLWYSVTSY